LSLESVFLDLLAPAARHLGEMWDEDRAGFAEVTLGMTTLHQVLRELGPAFHSEAAATGRDLLALLVPAPGEQHNFGLAIVAEFFRRAGWGVTGEAMTTRGELVKAVRGTWFAVVGLSLASEVRLEALADAIQAIRRASRNPAVGILVGGPIFNAHPELVRSVGADATAVDGKHAVLQANGLLAAIAPQS
jgi:methanogenic corrinoid protein MtbC1